MSNLQKDINGTTLQGFAPGKIVEITADAEWTPAVEDRAFRVGTATGYFMNAVSAREAALGAGSITVIVPGYTYTFDTTQELEVM